MIQYLDWDSDFFGFKIGKLFISDINKIDPRGCLKKTKQF